MFSREECLRHCSWSPYGFWLFASYLEENLGRIPVLFGSQKWNCLYRLRTVPRWVRETLEIIPFRQLLSIKYHIRKRYSEEVLVE